jgi:hypothetical protein
MVPPHGVLFLCKVFKRKDLRPDFPVQACGLNDKAPDVPGAFFYLF